MRKWWFLFLFSPLLSSWAVEIDFETAMGKGTPAWEQIKTGEDKKRLLEFKILFEKNAPLLNLPSSKTKIPKEIHLIWLGPHPFPSISKERVLQWKKLHPHWEFHLWTDQSLEQLDPFFHDFSKHSIDEIPLFSLEAIFDKAVSFGEKARLLSYALLFERGGLYLDHDVKLMKTLDSLHEKCDFYCELEPLKTTILSSSVLPGPHLIGATSRHSILKTAMEKIIERKEKVEAAFLSPGQNTPLSILSLHRTVWPFSLAVSERAGQDNQIDLILPPRVFGDHLHEESWKEPEQKFEYIHKLQLQEILLQHKRALRWLYFGLIGTVIAPAIVFFSSSKRKEQKGVD